MKIHLEKHRINGKFLYYAFVSGANQILEHQSQINEINVFPVRDKDTGTNLASTVRSVIDNIKPYKSYKKTANSIAEMALMGARGNSGIIFAQFLYGANQETPNKKTINLSEFADSIYKSIAYVYESVENPVEGTMLTVIKDWAEFIYSQKNSIGDFDLVLINSMEVLEKSLKETTTKLKALNKSGLVDAGAKAFVLFVKGAIDFIKNRNIRKIVFRSTEKISLIHTEKITDEEIKYRFCTEAIIKNISQSKKELKSFLSKIG
ncbi:MAG: fatty acid-binding protein DegV, partial [Treponema sp.]